MPPAPSEILLSLYINMSHHLLKLILCPQLFTCILPVTSQRVNTEGPAPAASAGPGSVSKPCCLGLVQVGAHWFCRHNLYLSPCNHFSNPIVSAWRHYHHLSPAYLRSLCVTGLQNDSEEGS